MQLELNSGLIEWNSNSIEFKCNWIHIFKWKEMECKLVEMVLKIYLWLLHWIFGGKKEKETEIQKDTFPFLFI